jgi:hypothetical protein
MSKELKPPKIGQDIYVPGAMYLSRGSDDYVGGLAKVNFVKKEKHGKEQTFMVGVKEIPGTTWNWKFLSEEQKELKKEFKKNRAYPDPDDRMEFNWGD